MTRSLTKKTNLFFFYPIWNIWLVFLFLSVQYAKWVLLIFTGPALYDCLHIDYLPLQLPQHVPVLLQHVLRGLVARGDQAVPGQECSLGLGHVCGGRWSKGEERVKAWRKITMGRRRGEWYWLKGVINLEERFLIWHGGEGCDGRHPLGGAARPEQINIINHFVFFLSGEKSIYHLVPISDFQGMSLSVISDKVFDIFCVITWYY